MFELTGHRHRSGISEPIAHRLGRASATVVVANLNLEGPKPSPTHPSGKEAFKVSRLKSFVSYYLYAAALPLLAQPLPIGVFPRNVTVTAPADTPFALGSYGKILNVGPVGNIPIKYLGPLTTYGGEPNFVIVSPSTIVSPSNGLASTGVGVSLNPNIVPFMTSGNYDLILQFAPSDQPDKIVSTLFRLRLIGSGFPSIAAIVGAATLQPNISPGQLISIFGSNLSTPPIYGQPSEFGLYPTLLGNTKVTIDGILAPLLYVSRNQINCVAPYGIAGKKSVDLVVIRTNSLGIESPPFAGPVAVPVADTAPGIYTLDQSGSGQGVILNADPKVQNATTPNSQLNPAAAGSAITLFATGVGVWNLTYPDGAAVLVGDLIPFFYPKAPVSLTIGGQPAKLLYVAAVIGQVIGSIQINAIIPDGIASGPQPIVLKVGDNDNASQKVTISIK